MCGRYNLTATPESIAEHFQLPRLPRFQTSYNITPAQKILCIVELDDKSLKSVNLFWGLVPSWSKDDKNSHHLPMAPKCGYSCKMRPAARCVM